MRKRRSRLGAALALAAMLLAPAFTPPAQASDRFIGAIVMFAGNFAPRNFAFCDGQLLPIASNTALFSIVGTMYGGDGRTTLGLPDLRGRAAIHAGQGPGLSDVRIGAKRGAESVVLSQANLPSHTHSGAFKADVDRGGSDTPTGNVIAVRSRARQYNSAAPDVQMSSTPTLANTGGSQPTATRDPYLAVNFCIALVGLYPSRN